MSAVAGSLGQTRGPSCPGACIFDRDLAGVNRKTGPCPWQTATARIAAVIKLQALHFRPLDSRANLFAD